jgi:hypothetical protein
MVRLAPGTGVPAAEMLGVAAEADRNGLRRTGTRTMIGMVAAH